MTTFVEKGTNFDRGGGAILKKILQSNSELEI